MMNMGVNYSSYGLYSTSSKKIQSEQSSKLPQSHGGLEYNSGNSSSSRKFSFHNLSKLILPPLGSSGYSQNQTDQLRGNTISPMSSRYRCWETVMVVLVGYCAWVCPFEIAFMNSNPNKELYIADNIINLFFAADIILTFFVAYIDSTTHLLVRDRRKIATRYLSTWFLMDVASTIPLDLIALLFTGKHQVGVSYSILGILRFWRLRKVKQFFTRLEKDMRFSYFGVRCARLLSRNSIQSASNFVCRNHLPPRLKEQILAYMCLRFKAESLNQQQLIEQLPKTICKSIRHHLFLPTVEKVYLFKGVSREILLFLVADMKAEYIPPREDVILQNESPDEVYIIVSGAVEVIEGDMENEHIVSTLKSGDTFGEVGAFCCRPQSYTYRTRTLSQLLKIKTSCLIEAMKSRQEDNITMMKNFLQHHKKLKDLKLGDSFLDIGDEDSDPNMSINLLTVASTGNAGFLDELLKAKLDPDIGDSKGRTPLHIAASKGHEECVMVLLRHGCNIHLQDLNGNTALWEAISAKHHQIFEILYHWASISDPYISGDLLCTAARRNELTIMKELLKHGLLVDSKDRHGSTAIHVAIEENHVEMVKLLLMNGADIDDTHKCKLSSMNLNEALQKRELGHRIMVPDITDEFDHNSCEQEQKHNFEDFADQRPLRVSIYRGHPEIRRKTHCSEPGKLIRLPNSLEELKSIAGKKFGFDAKDALVTDEGGAEIDTIEVIRDNDKLFIAEDTNFIM